MVEVTKEFRFCAAHRLHGYKGPCSNLHGHNYRAEVTVTSEKLDDLGMVLDFGIIKSEFGGWIDRNWDHVLLLNSDDPLAEVEWDITLDLNFKTFLFVKRNPTAEVMAKALSEVVKNGLSDISSIRPVRVRIYETDSSWAEVVCG